MKPENAKPLATPADLSHCSLLDCERLIFEEIGQQKKIIHTLTVASQNLNEAVVMAYLFGFAINIDSSYSPDEWSLTGWNYFDAKQHEITYWSPGA